MINDELMELIDDEAILKMLDGAIVEISDGEDPRITTLITPGYEDLTVLIKRGRGDYMVTEISVDFIENVLTWSNEEGGTLKHHAGYSLYAILPYKLVKALDVACSGKHNAKIGKVMISNSDNRRDRFLNGYMHLLEKAHQKPEYHYRQPGQSPCTKRIEEILHEGARSRGELRAILQNEEYPARMIGRALNTLNRENRIQWEGSSYSPRQMLYEGPNTRYKE